MTEKPDRIRALFDDKHFESENKEDKNVPMNDAGAYLVYFFINGIRTAVLIDDKIPCYRNRRPLFAYNKAPKDE